MEQQEIVFENADFAREVFGPENLHLDIVSHMTGVSISSRGCELSISGEDPVMVSLARGFFTQIYGLVRAGHRFFGRDIEQGLGIMLRDPATPLAVYYKEAQFAVSPRKSVAPKDFFISVCLFFCCLLPPLEETEEMRRAKAPKPVRNRQTQKSNKLKQ